MEESNAPQAPFMLASIKNGRSIRWAVIFYVLSGGQSEFYAHEHKIIIREQEAH